MREKALWTVITAITILVAGRVIALPERSQSILRVRHAFAPPYDDRIYFLRSQGRVRIRVTVLQSGEVQDAVVTESFWNWNQTAEPFFLGYARKWLFEPVDQAQEADIVFDFKLLPKLTPDEDLGTVFVAPTTVEIRRREPPQAFFHE
jgi:hypothetical protein